MTWDDLRSALASRGLIRAESGAVSAVAISGVEHDSRQVARGRVFVALKGQHADGTAFARQAVQRGAAGIVSEAAAPADLQAPWLTVSDARLALAVAAAAFHGHPSRELRVVGITGTNGKTTTAYLLSSIFEAAGERCGLIGTVEYRIGDESRDATRTTPESTDIQALMREMVTRGCRALAMEVSSHALSLRRADEITFAAGVFTNLTRDHLDFHENMESYFRAKRRLFELLPPGAPSLVNLDDPRGQELAGSVGRPVTYAIARPADITPGPLSYGIEGLRFDIRTPRGSIGIRSKLVGRPNVYNILAAVSASTALGLAFDAIERGIEALESVPGRFQVVSSSGDDPMVVVDYAHTDDALRNLLETARTLTRGRLITVFGCGGDRDRTKRPLMGAVAGRLSDVIVITSDNPRSEDPRQIIDEIRRGLTPDTRRDEAQRVLTVPDRRDAIAQAVRLAGAGDLVLVAGKGHEKYQTVGDRTLPFDDVEVARQALAGRRTGSRVRNGS